jgi:hypothetical protein
MATIQELARLYGKSERTILRWRAEGQPIFDPETMAEIISQKRSRRGVSKFAPRSPIVTPKPAEERNSLLEELNRGESALICVHFALAGIRMAILDGDQRDIYARIGEVMAHTRPFVEEPDA